MPVRFTPSVSRLAVLPPLRLALVTVDAAAGDGSARDGRDAVVDVRLESTPPDCSDADADEDAAAAAVARAVPKCAHPDDGSESDAGGADVVLRFLGETLCHWGALPSVDAPAARQAAAAAVVAISACPFILTASPFSVSFFPSRTARAG